MDLAAPSGAPGELLIDPRNIIVRNNNGGVPGGETIVGPEVTTPGATFTASTGADTEWLRVETAAITGFNGTVTLNADRDIIVDDAVTKPAGQGGLGLLAGRNVTVNAAISVDGALTIAAGTGAIALDANLRATSLTLTAGGDIQQTGGDIRHRTGAAAPLPLMATSAGGAISLAQAGNGALAATFSAPGAVTLRSGRFNPGSGVDGAITIAGASSAGSVTLVAERANNGSAAGTIAVTAALTSAAGVTLNADGAITQGAAGAIVTGQDPVTGVLRIRDRTDAADGAAGSVALAGADNRVNALDALALGDVALRSIGYAAGPSNVPPANPTLRVDRAQGAAVTLEAPRIVVPAGGTRVVATTGNAALIAGEAADPLDPAPPTTLTIAGPVTAASGFAVQLRADRLDLTGASFDATQPGGSLFIVEVGPRTAGRTTRFGGADDPASLWIGQPSALTGADAQALRLGQTNIAGAPGSLTGGAVTLAADLAFGGILAISATGAVTQAAGTTLDIALLQTRGASDAVGAGSVALTGGTNLIAAVNVVAAGTLEIASAAPTLAVDRAEGESVTLRGADIALGDGTVRATGAAGRATLIASGSITQGAAGAIIAPEFAAEAQGGAIALTGSGNDIRGIADALTIAAGNGPLLPDAARGLYAAGTVALATQGALSVDGAVESRGGAVTLRAGALRLDARVAVSGAATPSLSLVTDSSGGADGGIGGPGTLLAARLSVTGDGDVALLAPGNTVTDLAATTAGGDFALATAGALTATGAVTAGGSLALEAGTALAFDATLTAPRIELRAGTTLTQGGGGVLASVAGATELLALVGTGDLALTLAGDVRVVDGGIAGAAGLSAPGAVALTAAGIEVAAPVQGASIALAGEAIALAAPLSTPLPAGTVSLTASGGGSASTITQTAAGVITAGLLTASAEGAIDLAQAANVVGSLGAFSFNDGFGYRSTTSFTVGAALAPANAGNADITIVADTGTISLLAPIAAGSGTVRLEATTGDIVQAAAGAAITAGRLEAAAGGDALLAPLLAADRNQVGTLGPVAVGAGGVFAFHAAGALTLDGSIAQAGTGGTLRIESGGALTLAAGAAVGFDRITLAATGPMTLDGTLGVAGTPVSEVRLGAGGAITQGGGAIIADALGLRATGDVELIAGTNQVRRIAAEAGGTFALDTAGALATALVDSVPLPGGGTAGLEGVIGSSVTLSATDLTINPGSFGTIGAGAFASAADGVLTLRADRLTLNSAIGAGDPSGLPSFNGTVAIAPRDVARDMVIGTDDPGALSLATGGALLLSSPDFGLLDVVARNIVLGRPEAGAGALSVAGASGVLNGINAVRLQAGSIALDAAFQVPTAGGLLTLAAGGDIVQGAGAVSAARLVATSAAGSVLLDGAAALNQVGQLAGGAGADFAFRGAGSYVIAAPGIAAPGGTVTLLAPSGGITQAPGAPVEAGRLAVTASGAAVLDGGAGAGPADLNRVGTLAPSSAASFTLRNGGALTVEGVSATAVAGGRITLEAPALTLAGSLLASPADGHVVLRTGPDFGAPGAGTAIVQAAGIIRARDLSVSAGDAVDLQGANEVARLVAGLGATVPSADSVVLRDGADFAFAGAVPNLEVAARVSAGTGSAVRIATDGLTVAPALAGTVFLAPGGVVRFQPFSTGGTVGLGGLPGLDAATYATALLQRAQADRLVIGEAGGGTITLRQALDLTGPSGPVTLELRSGGDILAGGFALSLQEVSAFATGAVALGGPGSAIQRVVAGETAPEGIRAGATVAITTSGALALDAPVIADGPSVALQAADFRLAPGVPIRSGPGPASEVRLRSTSPGGLGLGVTEPAPGLTAAEIALLDAQGGRLRLEGNGIALAGTVAVDPAAAGMLDLAATGAVTQTGGTLSAGALRVAGTSIQIDRAGNALPEVQATATGDIAIASDGAMTVLGTRSDLGGVRLEAGALALSAAAGVAAVQAGGTVALTATTGDIAGLSGLAAVVAPVLDASAPNGTITLTGDNALGVLAAVAGTGVTVFDSGGLAAGATGPGGTAIAGGVTLRAGSLALNDVLATGTVALEATAGDIIQQPGARLVASTLLAAANGVSGSIRLDGGANEVGSLGALAATDDITLRSALALTVGVPLSVGDFRGLTLEAPTLTLAADLAAGTGGRIVLRTGAFEGGLRSGGDILQAGGTITTPLLAALAGGGIVLDAAGNAIGALGGGASASGAALGLGLSAGTAATLRSDAGPLGITGAVDLAAGGALVLRADDFAIGAALRVPGGSIALLPATTNAGIGYVLGGAAGSATAGRITLDGAELALLPNIAPAAELSLGALGETGDVSIAGPVPLATNGAAPRVLRLVLTGDGALVQDAGTALDVAALTAIFPNGAVRLDPGGAGNRIAALQGVVAGGDVVVRGGAGPMELRDGGGGAAITVIPGGGSVTLRADDLDIQAAVQAPGGTISLLPETAGRTVTLGGAAPGALALDSAEIARLGGAGATLDAPGAQRLRIGGDGAGATAGDIRITGDVPLRGGASVRIGTLELVAGGSVQQTGGGVDVGTVTGTAGGDFRLGLAGNAFDAATGITAGTLPAPGAPGAVDLASGGDLAATGIATGASVRLAAGGALSAGALGGADVLLRGDTVRLTGLVQGSGSVAIESAGAVTQDPGALIVTGLFTLNGGSILLPEDNAFIELTGLIATGPVLALNTVLPLLVSGAVEAAGSLSLTTDQGLSVGNAGSITVTGGPGTASLTAGTGLTYAGGLVTGGAASLAAGGVLGFTGTAAIGGNAGFVAGGALSLGGVVSAAGEVTATAGGALATTAQVSAGGAVRLGAGGLLTASNRLQATGGDLVLSGGAGFAANGLFLAGGAATLSAAAGPGSLAGLLSAAGDVSLTAAATLQSTATVVAGGALALSAGGGLTLGGSHAATGAITAVAGGPLTGTGALQAGASVTLNAGQALSLQGSVQTGGDLVLRAGAGLGFAATAGVGGTADLLAAGGDLIQSGTITAGGVVLAAAGALGQAGTVVAGGEVRLSAGGALAHAGGTSAGTRLLMSAGGDLTQSGTASGGTEVQASAGGALSHAGSTTAGGALRLVAGGALRQTGEVRSAGGAVELSAGAGLALSGQTTAATDLVMTAAGAADLTSGKVTAAGEVRLTAGAVNLQGFQIDPTTILLQTGGTMSIADSGLVSSDGITLAGGTVTLRNSSFITGALDVSAGGTLALEGGLYVIGRAVVFSGPGGLSMPAMVTVRPRDGLLPAVVFDTRAATALPDPITVVQPDQPGLPASQQPTQVRVPNAEAPGDFGLPSSAPAGPLAINLDAGSSPVFLLIDGGSATGTIVSAGRLGIHGTGGTVELTGRFVDANGAVIGGAGAARFADGTRPAASGSLSRYRINGCVVSSINCVVPSQVISIPQAPPQRVELNIGGGRITDPDVQMPNVAEEDY